MTKIETEKLAVLENEVGHIKSDVQEIKSMLKDHIHWEAKKYEDMEKHFATSKSVDSLAADLSELPLIIEKRHALKWTEKVLIIIMITIIVTIFATVK